MRQRSRLVNDIVVRLREEIEWHEVGEDFLGRQYVQLLRDALAEIEHLREEPTP